jgi:hypothetical protein
MARPVHDCTDGRRMSSRTGGSGVDVRGVRRLKAARAGAVPPAEPLAGTWRDGRDPVARWLAPPPAPASTIARSPP